MQSLSKVLMAFQGTFSGARLVLSMEVASIQLSRVSQATLKGRVSQSLQHYGLEPDKQEVHPGSLVGRLPHPAGGLLEEAKVPRRLVLTP